MRRLAARYDALTTAVEARRAEAAAEETRAARATEAAMAEMPEPVRRLARDTVALRAAIEETLAVEAEASRQRRASRAAVVELESRVLFARVELEQIGPTFGVGQLIRDGLLRELPSLVELDQAAAGRRAATERAVDRRVALEREGRALFGFEGVVASLLESIPAERRAELGDDWLQAELAELVAAKFDSISALHAVNGRYLAVLARLDELEQRKVDIVRSALRIAREELVWIRSLSVLSADDVDSLGPAVAWLTSRDAWRATARSAFETLRSHPLANLALVLALALVLRRRARSIDALPGLARLVSRARTDRFRHTLVAAVHTLVLAATWPAVLVWAGWLARSEPWSGPFSVAIGEALIAAGLVLGAISLLRRACEPAGLAEHLRWPEPVCEALRRELRWSGPVIVVAGALVVLSLSAKLEDVTLALRRPALIVAWLALTVLIWRLLGRGGALRAHMRDLDEPSFVARSRNFWYPALQAVPLALAGGSALGYHYAATELSPVVVRTLWLVVGLLILRDLLLRWFYVAQRRARFEDKLRAREEMRAEREAPEEDGMLGRDEPDEDIDYRELEEQAGAVIRGGVLVGALLGLWGLWGDLLPAVGALERVDLPLARVELIDGIERQVPVTLADLALGLVVLAGALFIARNLGGLLGFALLRRLRLDSGASYAIVTLGQYVVIAFGVIYASAVVGLQWSKLQWLVAALGVGLGFGLQEIVANFVSGIILLLERPVRVGDIVSVGGVDGKVERIRIRATTIVTWERKELLVPNKEFITTRVLNWTLTNPVLRLFVPVGVAYGCDVRKARELILEAALENESVLDDPEPSVHFGAFGADSLELELRCYVPGLDVNLATKTAVLDAIYDKLNEAGIEIAFPQRDVHLDLSGPIDVNLRDARGGGAGDRP